VAGRIAPHRHVVPYEFVRWFMEQVAEQVQRCRLAFEQGAPEAAQ
jgi:hypothetical protein